MSLTVFCIAGASAVELDANTPTWYLSGPPAESPK
jgi:hypothetical protein